MIKRRVGRLTKGDGKEADSRISTASEPRRWLGVDPKFKGHSGSIDDPQTNMMIEHDKSSHIIMDLINLNNQINQKQIQPDLIYSHQHE